MIFLNKVKNLRFHQYFSGLNEIIRRHILNFVSNNIIDTIHVIGYCTSMNIYFVDHVSEIKSTKIVIQRKLIEPKYNNSNN